MMRIKWLIGIFFMVLCSGLQAQESCDLNRHFNDFIELEKEVFEGKSFLFDRVVEVKSDRCFSVAVNANLSNLGYVLTNFKKSIDYDDLNGITDSLILRKTFVQKLESDSLFNAVLSDFSKKVLDKSVDKDTVSMNQLMDFAVKFFSIVRVDENDNFVGKMCVGINDIEKTQPKRHAFAEAFCFSTIMENYQGTTYNMYDEFVKGLIELGEMNLGINRDEQLLRAQGAMYVLMWKNDPLREMLKTVFEQQKDYLPFVLAQ